MMKIVDWKRLTWNHTNEHEKWPNQGDSPGTRLHAPSASARRTTGARIGWGEFLTWGYSCRLTTSKKKLKNSFKRNWISPPARACGMPYLQGPKATGGGADRRHRRRGERNSRWVLWPLPLTSRGLYRLGCHLHSKIYGEDVSRTLPILVYM
jgi:hypothetical protein